jgi:predicted NodU family carbamoyl transferase
MQILGISAFYHDSAAALINDGKIVAAAQEERFSRKKQDSAFPKSACQRRRDSAVFSRSKSAAGMEVIRPPISGALLFLSGHF